MSVEPVDRLQHRTVLAQNLFEIVRLLESHKLGESSPAAASNALTWLQVRAFWFIGREPGLSQRSLAERLGQSAPTTSKLVSRLNELGFLDLQRDSTDVRIHRVFLSHRGQDVATAIYATGDDLVDSAVGELPSAVAEDLTESITFLAAALTRSVGNATQ